MWTPGFIYAGLDISVDYKQFIDIRKTGGRMSGK